MELNSREVAGLLGITEQDVRERAHAGKLPRPTLGIFFTAEPIDMGALDGKPVHTLFVLLSLTPKQHLELLARLAFIFRQPDFVRLLRERTKAETICEWIRWLSARPRDSKT